MISERVTASRHCPSYVQRPIHSRQNRVVPFAASHGSIWGGASWCDGYQTIANAIRWPAATENAASTNPRETSTGTLVRSSTASGPATARTPRRIGWSHGTASP